MVLVRRLIWDPWNVGHIARHQVAPEEVEQACHGEHIQRVSYAGRIMLIGLTEAGRTLAVVLEPRGSGVYRVITARSASRKERRLFERTKGGAEW